MQKIKIALGTANPHKLEEINDIIKHSDLDGVEFVLVDGEFDPVEDGKTFEENSYIKAKEAAKLMKELDGVSREKRTAHFLCTMTLVAPNGEKLHPQVGRIDGYIAEKPSGSFGFGYDPLFFISELNKTMADMTMTEKNTLSHRAKALIPMIEKIKSL